MTLWRPPLYNELSAEELDRIEYEIMARQLLEELDALPVHRGKPMTTQKPKAEYL